VIPPWQAMMPWRLRLGVKFNNKTFNGIYDDLMGFNVNYDDLMGFMMI
jgi:hypothetical protein